MFDLNMNGLQSFFFKVKERALKSQYSLLKFFLAWKNNVIKIVRISGRCEVDTVLVILNYSKINPVLLRSSKPTIRHLYCTIMASDESRNDQAVAKSKVITHICSYTPLFNIL